MPTTTYQTPGELRLKIKLAAGLVETRTTDDGETVVEIEPLDDREASREAADKTTPELRGNELVIDVPQQSRFGFRGGDGQVRVTVAAPKGVHVHLRTASADARLRGELGVDRRRQRLRHDDRRAGRRQRHLQVGLGRHHRRRRRRRRQPEHRVRRRPAGLGRWPRVGQAGLRRRRDRPRRPATRPSTRSPAMSRCARSIAARRPSSRSPATSPSASSAAPRCGWTSTR